MKERTDQLSLITIKNSAKDTSDKGFLSKIYKDLLKLNNNNKK